MDGWGRGDLNLDLDLLFFFLHSILISKLLAQNTPIGNGVLVVDLLRIEIESQMRVEISYLDHEGNNNTGVRTLLFASPTALAA